ncbi:MAG: hypothetical protein KAG61_07120 [Bacteriovoracaceae bacterium]|nr:hypothetical protein [Bacteriovoracaceae bacterium]
MSKRLSGFTFIKNGLTLGYPILESVRSIEPLCDEIIINVGYDDPSLEKDDGTYDYLRENLKGDKYVFCKSYWSPEMTSKGLILSEQTNIALAKCTGKYCQYIQGDEALHERDFDAIRKSMDDMDQNEELDGIVFKYLHFYGNVDVVLYTQRIYRREVRLIRNGKGIKSHLDAQGFKTADGQKPRCKQVEATVHHYGWARKEQVMATKVKVMDKLYHGKDFEQKEKFSYKRMWGIKAFKSTHPTVMVKWIDQHRNDIDILTLPLVFKPKDVRLVISDFVESLTGYRIGEYKNFKIIE